MITVSWDTCLKKPKCKGCYLESLKIQPENPVYTNSNVYHLSDMLDQHSISSYNIEAIFVNINCNDDFDRLERLVSYSSTPDIAKHVPIHMIIPLNIAATSSNYYSGAAIYRRIVSINTFDKRHMSILSRKLWRSMDVIPVVAELSFNSETLHNLDIITKLRHSITSTPLSTIINYIPTEILPKEEVRDALKYILSKLYILTPELSACLATTMGSPFPGPCIEYQCLEYLDNHLIKEGCPYVEGILPCQL